MLRCCDHDKRVSFANRSLATRATLSALATRATLPPTSLGPVKNENYCIICASVLLDKHVPRMRYPEMICLTDSGACAK